MQASAEVRLLSLLFDEGRELENLKFFPGDECASSEELFDAAHEAISMTFNGASEIRVPGFVGEQMAIGDAVARL